MIYLKNSSLFESDAQHMYDPTGVWGRVESDPSESLFLAARIPFPAQDLKKKKKSVAGPLSRFLHCSDIWCPVCARMPPLHSGVCFWRCT